MRQVIQTGPITPADELRDLLTLSEKRASTVRGTGPEAVELLRGLDRIAVLWPQLEASGLDLKPEAGRWETIQATVRRRASSIVRRLAEEGGAAAVRERVHPEGTDAWWWHLDAEVRDQNRRRWRRIGLTSAIVLVIGVAIWGLIQILFPVDPKVRDSLRAMDAGDALVQQQNDFSRAIGEYRRATEINPDEPEAWTRLGVALEQTGDAAGARQAFDRAAGVLGDEASYRLALGGTYFTLGLLDPAERELLAVLDINPANPYAYYYLASVYEGRGRTPEAVEALQKASQYAEEQDVDELVAMARYRMGMLMQAQMNQPPTRTPAP